MFLSSSQRQVFSPLHHFLYLSYSKECHSLEPCLRQGLTRPQWMTDWMSQLGSYQEKDTDCICCQHPCGYVCVKMSKLPFLGIVCAYVWLSMWQSLCVKVVLVVCYFYVPLVHSACPFTLCMFLHWHGALQCAYGYWHMMQSCVFAFLYIRVYYLSAHGTHEGEC